VPLESVIRPRHKTREVAEQIERGNATLDIGYLNTNLDLMGPNDLRALAAALEGHGLLPLHVGRGEDGRWRARFETVSQRTEPAGNIADLLAAIEAPLAPTQIDWQACTAREFNIGYDCGRGTFAFNRYCAPPSCGEWPMQAWHCASPSTRRQSMTKRTSRRRLKLRCDHPGQWRGSARDRT
jgi:hypothetical protein